MHFKFQPHTVPVSLLTSHHGVGPLTVPTLVKGMSRQLKGFMSIAHLLQFLHSNPTCPRLFARVYELGDTSSISRISHLHLVALSIEADDVGLVLDALRLPALEYLQLVYPNSTPQSGMLPKGSLFDFVAKSGARLRCLRIFGSIYDYQGVSHDDQFETVTKLQDLEELWLYNGVEDCVEGYVSDIVGKRREAVTGRCSTGAEESEAVCIFSIHMEYFSCS